MNHGILFVRKISPWMRWTNYTTNVIRAVHSAESYGLIIARALATREASPMEGLAIEAAKIRNLLRYQMHAMRENLRIYRIDRILS
jgi:hypothetical protein